MIELGEKSDITNRINHNFARIWIGSFEKILTFHNVLILIKSVVNKNENKYYYNIFLEKVLYKNKCNTEYFQKTFLYYKCYFSIKLTFLKELMLINKATQKSAMFVTIVIF